MGRIIDGKLAPYGIHPYSSCQYFVDLGGEILQAVPENEMAWQAGKSYWKGYNDLNRHSIGCEFLVEGATTLEKLKEIVNDVYNPPFTEEQYESGSNLFAYLAGKYHWGLKDIRGHNEVSTIDIRPDPKFDPGEAFDMFRLKSLVQSKVKYSHL